MFLFIGESIGMQELLFIGVIALIVLGPRRLPQLARTFGKYMAEFRRTTNEFKETWEREVDFEEFKDEGKIKTISPATKTFAKTGVAQTEAVALPEIKEIDAASFDGKIPLGEPEISSETPTETVKSEKQNWL